MHTDPSPNEAFSSGRIRRTHSAEFKAQVIAACRVEGVSKAAVAMAYGINANLARRWVVEDEARHERASIASVNNVVPTFVPVQMPLPAPAPTPAALPVPTDIRVELRRGPVTINVSWPCSSAAECAAWLRELMR